MLILNPKISPKATQPENDSATAEILVDKSKQKQDQPDQFY